MEHKSVQKYYILLNKTNKNEKNYRTKSWDFGQRTTEDSDGGGGKPRFNGSKLPVQGAHWRPVQWGYASVQGAEGAVQGG